jgi:hypothetical protein
VPPTHAETVQAHNDALRHFEATHQAFGRAVERLWTRLLQAGPSDRQLRISTEVLVYLTRHLQTLINVMERHHDITR